MAGPSGFCCVRPGTVSGKMLFDKMIEHADGMLAAMKLERGDDLISEALRFTGSDRILSGGVVDGEVRRG